MTPLLELLYVLKKNKAEKMRKKITLTIDSDVYDELEELPRKVSISEFVDFMLKGYVETFKKGRVLSKKRLTRSWRRWAGKSSGKG
jgi:predicted CopG family antitoxin